MAIMRSFGTSKLHGLILIGLFCGWTSSAATLYVWEGGSADAANAYNSWAGAARTIQDAVDASMAGDTILVTNGVYATGGRAVYGTMTNRVALNRAVTLKSVNGPKLTVIQGYQVPGTTNGDGAVRCVYLTNSAVLSGFTLTHGATRSLGELTRERSGGGVWCVSTNATVTNCILTGNSAINGGGANSGTLNNCALINNSAQCGGGANAATLNNCLLTENRARDGAGAGQGILNSCTLTGNLASDCGGGAYNATLNNTILYYNKAPISPNYFSPRLSLRYCCTTPLPSNGVGNITSEPQIASISHLGSGSPCRGAGSSLYATGVDIDGESWLNPPSIGCDEYRPAASSGSLEVAISVIGTNVAAGFAVELIGQIEGQVSDSVWSFGDGTIVSNQPYASHSWAAPGDYPVVLTAFNESHPVGVSATLTIRVLPQERYVSAESLNPAPPFTTWATAARTIQDAVDAVAGGTVWVTNGVYASGGRAAYGGMTNRLVVPLPITVRSVNGPESTVIQGYQVPGTTNGDGAIRCVYLADGTTLSGFTLTGGATRTSGDSTREQSGGGAWCASTNTILTNCIIKGNMAVSGGGIYSGTLNRCALEINSARTGGGTAWSTLNNCNLAGNAAFQGGGAYCALMNNCVITDNIASWEGGGAYGGILNNCNVIANSASILGGGANCCARLNNCILLHNKAASASNYSASVLDYCCTTPLPDFGDGNVDLEPWLASASHLSTGSPCRGAGAAAYTIGTDIDGESWLTPPSIGCDEFRVGNVTGPVDVAIETAWTNVSVGAVLDLTGRINGRVFASVWNFGDGTVISNRPYATHAWGSTGDFHVVLTAYNESHPEGVSASLNIRVVPPVRYVSAESRNPESPFITWETAARIIQDAVDTAQAGDTVLVTNGFYATGGLALPGSMTNRVVVARALTVRSINGPERTVIQGCQVSGTTNGDAAIRCVYLADGAALSGFTLTNGATCGYDGAFTDPKGGGVFCASTNAMVTNCIIRGNSAKAGGGAYSGTLRDCVLLSNSAANGGGACSSTLLNCHLVNNTALYGGGCYESALTRCALNGNRSSISGGGSYDDELTDCTLTANSGGSSGGGASGSWLTRCVLESNSASVGGGAEEGTLINCLIRSNTATYSGGGVHYGTLRNCTLLENSADSGGGAGIRCTLDNCILYYNTAVSADPNYSSSCTINYCCTIPLPEFSEGNVGAEPIFVDRLNGNLRLQSNSPCINTGNNAKVIGLFDFDGNLRIVGRTVDMGAFEYQPLDLDPFHAWLNEFGLPTDGSADAIDSDADGLDNWQEWQSGTIPTDAKSALQLYKPSKSPSGWVIGWQSVPGRTYFVERATNLVGIPEFQRLSAEIPAQAGAATYVDTQAPSSVPCYYRVGTSF